MTLFFMVLIAAFLLLALMMGLRRFKASTRPHNRRVAAGFSRQETFLSPAEADFFNVLEKILGGRYRVFGKVRVADLLNVEAKGDRSAWQGAYNRISRKHVDFVICDTQNFSVIGAIELDGAGHGWTRRQTRDTFVDGAFATAGIPLLRFSVLSDDSPNQIAERLSAQMGLGHLNRNSGAGVSTKEKVPVLPAAAADPAPSPAAAGKAPGPQDRCTCGGMMIKQLARTGPYRGRWILECSNFPKCQNIKPFEMERALGARSSQKIVSAGPRSRAYSAAQGADGAPVSAGPRSGVFRKKNPLEERSGPTFNISLDPASDEKPAGTFKI